MPFKEYFEYCSAAAEESAISPITTEPDWSESLQDIIGLRKYQLTTDSPDQSGNLPALLSDESTPSTGDDESPKCSTDSEKDDSSSVDTSESSSTSDTERSESSANGRVKHDTLSVSEYAPEIFLYFRSMEEKYKNRKAFLSGQAITAPMREKLIDWLIDVQTSTNMYLDTLHLSVSIVDSFLQENADVKPDSFQLVGATALMIADKYEDPGDADIEYYKTLCLSAFSKTQFRQMEWEMLTTLDFSLGRPLSLHFLRRYNTILDVSREYHSLGKFILELALLNYEMCEFKPSLQAAAACCLAVGVLREVEDLSEAWPPTLVYHSKYWYTDMKEVIVRLAAIIVRREDSEFRTVIKKYESEDNDCISKNPLLSGPLLVKLYREYLGSELF